MRRIASTHTVRNREMFRRIVLVMTVAAGTFWTASDADAGWPRRVRAVYRPVVVAPPVYAAPVRQVSYYSSTAVVAPTTTVVAPAPAVVAPTPVVTTYRAPVVTTYRVAPAIPVAPAVVPVRRFPLVPPVVRPVGVFVW